MLRWVCVDETNGISPLHHQVSFVFIIVCIASIVAHITTNVVIVLLSEFWYFDHVGNSIYECFPPGVIAVPIDDTCLKDHQVQTTVSYEGLTERGHEVVLSLVSSVLLIFL